MTRPRLGGCLLGVVLAGVLALSGCAEISVFDVRPLRVCVGDMVTVTWSAKGSVSLTSTPAIADLDGAHLPSAGTKAVKIAQSTRLTLKASRLFKDKHTETDVVVVPRSPVKPFGGIASCNQQAGAVEVAFALDGKQVAAGVHAVEVTNPLDRALVVSHDGPPQTLGAHAGSDRFKGQPAVGKWLLSTPLGAGESCDQALQALSDRLSATFKFDCGG